VRDILAAKVAGCLYGGRWVGVLLGVILLLALLNGGLHWLDVLAIVVAWTIWTAFFVSLGLWFSARSTSTTRSVFLTVVSGLLILAGPPLLAHSLSRLARHLEWSLESIRLLEDAIRQLSPATTMAALAKGDPTNMNGFDFLGLFGFAALGLACGAWRRLRWETERS
jgi:hypothetical protein